MSRCRGEFYTKICRDLAPTNFRVDPPPSLSDSGDWRVGAHQVMRIIVIFVEYMNRFFMKLFRTSSTEVVKQCQEYFDFEIPSVLWAKRVNKFENKLKNTDNIFYKNLL